MRRTIMCGSRTRRPTRTTGWRASPKRTFARYVLNIFLYANIMFRLRKRKRGDKLIYKRM